MTSSSKLSPSRRITRSRTSSHQVSFGATNDSRGATGTARGTPITKRIAPYINTLAAHRIPPVSAHRFGIIQEEVAHDLFELLVAAMLWNRTKGTQARPVFGVLIKEYPTPERLAEAKEGDLAVILRPVGLQNSRAKRLIAFGQIWLRDRPSKHRRYRSLHYPLPQSGKDVGATEILDENDDRQGWEVAHLPGIGPYALDCFRIFHRDMLRGVALDRDGAGAPPDFEPEWKRVLPADKELKAYIKWKWLKLGQDWDPASGRTRSLSAKTIAAELARRRSRSPELI